MEIPTEPIGSIPRPLPLLQKVAAGEITDPNEDPLYEAAVKDTIERFEATGSPSITDGEQRKFDNFWTYSVHGLSNTAADGFKIPFTAGHTRRMPRLTHGPFRYKRFPLKIATVPVQLIVESVSTMIEPQIRSCDMKYEVVYSEDGLSVLADKERVEQILLNLLANAVKFTPAGGAIAISTSASEKEVLLHVRDTGRGIPADKLEEVFQPFVQIHSPGPGVSKGTGLGLPISRELARAMGGDLSAASESGNGSTFTLCLPRVK